MKADFEKIYFYSASLITLVVIVFILVLIAGSLVDFFIPPAYINEFSGMDERIIREQIVIRKYGPNLNETEIEKKMEEVTQEEVESYKKKQLEMARNESLKNLLRQVFALIFIVPIYAFHFKKARKLSIKNIQEKRN